MGTIVTLPPFDVDATFSPSGFRAMGKVNDWGFKYIDPIKFHEEGFRGRAVHFVLDTMDISDHPDVEPKLLKEYCKSYINEPLGDGNGHGTWVASRIAGLQDNSGVMGIAPDSPIVGVKCLSRTGQGSSEQVAAAITYAANVALPDTYKNYPRILNMSLGSSQPMDDVEAALKYAVGKGCIIVAAAGNSGGSISYPAAYKDLTIAVGAFDQQGSPASFSSRGPALDFAAPGVNLYGAWINKSYSVLQGTSMATPAISGVVDLLIQKFGLPVEQKKVEEALRKYAVDLHTVGWDDRTGWGTFILSKITDEPKPSDMKLELKYQFDYPNPRAMRRQWLVALTVSATTGTDVLKVWDEYNKKIRLILATKQSGNIQSITQRIKDVSGAVQVTVESDKTKVTL